MPTTPGSQLKNCYIEEIEGMGLKIKVVEQSGVTLKRMLQRSDPFRKKECTTSTIWSAAPVKKGLAEVPVLLMSWNVNFAARNTLGKHHEVHTPKERNTCELWNRGGKVQ